MALVQSQQLTRLEQEYETLASPGGAVDLFAPPLACAARSSRQVLKTLPPQITLSRIATEREAVAPDPSQPIAPPRTVDEIKAEEAKRMPAERDLNRLRVELDNTQTVVTLEGMTHDNISLHAYLGRLASQGLFARSELSSLESGDKDHPGVSVFRARLIVRPGYGQPGSGPLLADGGQPTGGAP